MANIIDTLIELRQVVSPRAWELLLEDACDQYGTEAIANGLSERGAF